jgi:hypothetical protein
LSGEAGSDSEVKAHWAKYVCVLVSGYIEQSVKEILLEHAESKSSPRIVSYVTRTWPSSKNMACTAISEILQHFDVDWQKSFDDWSSKDERKKEINEIISWRNNIAHGKESSTNNVTINSVGIKFNTACSLIDFLEGVVGK